MATVAALLLAAAAADPAALSGAEMRDLRAAVYGGDAFLTVPERLVGGVAGPEVVVVPGPVTALHRRKPRAVLVVLLAVVEGGRPADSVRAAAYALALTAGPAVGALPVRHFDEGTYDDPAPARINSRSGWVAGVRRKLAGGDRVAAR
jgi:hypothetical protein